ncbi:MAG: dockerin type I repeat-containing protein [Porcipelethomonas sp.]
MKNFKRIIAAVSAAALAATAMFSAVSVSAADMVEKAIEYTGPSANAFNLENDGVSLRMNLYNVWGQETTDLANTGAFMEKVAVTFTVDGLGENSANIAEDGTETPYEAYLSGAIGTDSYWGPSAADDNTVDNKAVAIEGDGTYTAEFLLNDPADTILCLILSTNINVYQYTETGKPADSGITFSIDSVTTMAEGSITDPDVPDGTIGTAALVGAIGATQVWGADEVTDGSKTANINGDAQYEVVWNVTDGGTDTVEFLAVQIPGLSSDKYADLAVTVDGVYVDGNEVEGYTTSADAINLAYTEGGAACTRIYLIDGWAGTGVADIAGNTAITSSLKVVFTVSGTGIEGTSNVSNYDKGDITRDGKVNLYDAIEIAKYMMNMIKLDEEQLSLGDMNGDGKVNLYDAIAVCNIIMG